ncbi:23S rRNA (guanine(745)-N(1))-methyltransferase [Flocculibacter collagenilyticus]|uniref:23S rRNA (guanine(745)-N(1))-methyltransferase n=1 Tax=Flocculibacter collagenilyticus TaxID=2744479 RepID=UPI0018F4C0CB|nr:23S rRNA (guanine(745)-N(1))-methyltransferase [Flocculibacter collagenilyticus]
MTDIVQTKLSAPHYRCPLCKEPLSLIENSFKCSNNHSFDKAKEQYVNLLPVQQKNSLQPGDDKSMVLARRTFLSLGYYDKLRVEVINIIKSTLSKHDQSNEATNLLDLGCGEGFYTALFSKELQQLNSSSTAYGIDISKSAVKYAAKRDKQSHYCVATNASLPFNDGFADIITNVFAPIDATECARILKPKGELVRVSPGPKHLIELKSEIYDTPRLHKATTEPEGFKQTDNVQVSYQIALTDPQAIEALIDMTPFAWKISTENKKRLLNEQALSLSLDFVIDVYQVA